MKVLCLRVVVGADPYKVVGSFFVLSDYTQTK